MLSNKPFRHQHRSNPSQYRGKIYISSQYLDQLCVSKLMEYYVPANNAWGAFQVATTFTTTADLKEHLYATEETWGSDEIYRYNPQKNCCNKLKKPPTTLFGTCVVTGEQYIYLIGGRSNCYGGTPSSTTCRCDPSTDDHEWEELAPINQARFDAFGAAMNGKVYIAGGSQGQEALNTCEVYNPLTNEWQLMPSLRTPRMSASMVCHDGQLYVLGGVNSSTRVLSVETFDSEQSQWKLKSFIPVACFETTKEEKEQKNKFKACFARLCRGVIDKLNPLNM